MIGKILRGLSSIIFVPQMIRITSVDVVSSVDPLILPDDQNVIRQEIPLSLQMIRMSSVGLLGPHARGDQCAEIRVVSLSSAR